MLVCVCSCIEEQRLACIVVESMAVLGVLFGEADIGEEQVEFVVFVWLVQSLDMNNFGVIRPS